MSLSNKFQVGDYVMLNSFYLVGQILILKDQYCVVQLNIGRVSNQRYEYLRKLDETECMEYLASQVIDS